ncbi:hypothetical protein FDH93_gp115 [Pseudomonas phage vB_PaeM_G1]|uniref:3'-phosphatase, 5'-polynucleotide kinase n=1 Tax=Pseudomonas phage vB_PaeM_G1 TaxID=1983539 RepID=A0A218L415_9CAUD|nr:hypothetical protein FDH93_gp115 [Pseudomonas phage vB_PaeM_G1]ARW57382.1 hypothetical protein vBPaeMG1_115 [Pseudomonas phage vB_PaeM_G1]
MKLGPSVMITASEYVASKEAAEMFKTLGSPPGWVNPVAPSEDEGEHTGGSSSYYQVEVRNPTSGGEPYIGECNDFIEALDMTFAEANVFKAIWRKAAERTLGKKKKGNNAVYDAEKMVFFSQRELIQTRAKAETKKE